MKDGLSSADLAVPPTEKMPKPKIRAFKTNRMSKLVKLSVRTSEVDDALAKNSRAVVTSSFESSACALARAAAITAVP